MVERCLCRAGHVTSSSSSYRLLLDGDFDYRSQLSAGRLYVRGCLYDSVNFEVVDAGHYSVDGRLHLVESQVWHLARCSAWASPISSSTDSVIASAPKVQLVCVAVTSSSLLDSLLILGFSANCQLGEGSSAGWHLA